MGEIRNLWGKIPEKPEGTLPRIILNKQKEYLDQEVGDEIVSEINHSKERGKVRFRLSVYPVESDELQTDIVSVLHGINIYPASIKNEITGEEPWQADNEESFMRHLERVLSSPDVMNTINRFRLMSSAHKKQI
ncbi:MAG: hypothetical protein RLN85_01060 [Pseudomonadales bacterium]|jgi:hypothetical protein